MTPRIAIVGGGLTGAAAAIELLRTMTRSFDLTVVDPAESLGHGLAYGKAAPFHLLNVRAGRLGVLYDQPDDFAVWARGRNFGIRARHEPPDLSRAFLSRRLFGSYVETRLREEVASRPDVKFTHAQALATSVRRTPNGFVLSLGQHEPVTADILILATGYGSPSASSRFGRTPFADIDPDEVRAAKSALFVGTGMTFVDEFLRLRSLGFRGEALAVSRYGLLPEVHRVNETPRCLSSKAADLRLRSLLGAFRAAMEKSDLPAAAAVDLALGLREGGLQPLWQSLGLGQQRRFLRHLRSYWNVVRHRLPPEAHAQIRRAVQSGALKIEAARVTGIEDGEIRFQSRGALAGERRFDLAFDCTGHRPEIRSPLVQSLVRQGLARPDAHALGLAVDADGGMVNRLGVRMPGLFALGPLGHGSLYEITAVPEIVTQCAAMAKRLEAQLRASSTQASARATHGWAHAG
jgi:uncharacterized NAD(P)/FAD-binding protein YdhS